MQKIILASNNPGKLNEIQSLLGEYGLSVQSQADYDTPEVAETGLSFVENAIIKARHAAAHCESPALADDSGIAVDALAGAPGIYSARYAGTEASDAANITKLLSALTDFPEQTQRKARFVCVMALVMHAKDPCPIICQAQWEGYITHAPQGEHGFGYDPVFFVPSHQCTSAQMEPKLKKRLSHRGQALQLLLQQCMERFAD